MITPDKIKHFVAGCLIGAFAPLFGWYAFLAVILIAIAKEVYDRLSGKGTPELMDIGATVAGGLLVVGGVELVGYFL